MTNDTGAEVAEKPAPDSPLTGPVGVPDIVRSAVANAVAADGFANGPAAKHYAALRALDWVETLIAARPAAQGAQGAQGAWVSQAADDVLAERRRQVAAEGYSFEHDDNHARGELAAAAACYALPLAVYTGCLAPFPPRGTLGLKLANHVWPWAPGSFRRKSRREDLIRAAALLIAEVERLDRLEVRGK